MYSKFGNISVERSLSSAFVFYPCYPPDQIAQRSRSNDKFRMREREGGLYRKQKYSSH